MTPIRKSQGKDLQSSFGAEEGSLSRGHMECRGRVLWDRARYTVGCLEKVKARKGSSVFAMYKSKKMECGAIR